MDNKDKRLVIPREELDWLKGWETKLWKMTWDYQWDLISTLKEINSSSMSSSIIAINEMKRNEQLLTLQYQLNELKSNYPIISLFMLDEQKRLIEDIMNWDKDAVQKRINSYMEQSNMFDHNDKQFLVEWYKELIDIDESMVGETPLYQINYLLKDTDMLNKFTTKNGLYSKTLFRKCWLSPSILQNDKLIDEYRWFRNITVWMQYFLSWLLDDKDTFWSLELQLPYEIPLRDWNKIISMKMVNTKFWLYDNYLPKSDLTYWGEIFNNNYWTDISDRAEGVNKEDAEKYIQEYLSECNNFSDTFYTKWYMSHPDKSTIPVSLSSLMRPIIKDRGGSIAIYSCPYYKAIWEKDIARQKTIETTFLSNLEKHKNDYDNVLWLIIYYKIIKDWLLIKWSIGNIMTQDPYKQFTKKIYYSIDAAYRHYIWWLEEISIVPFKEAIEKRYKDLQSTDIFKRVQDDLHKSWLWI